MTRTRTATSARRTLLACIAALVVASIAYRVLIFRQLQHTSLVFIGIPALLALALTGVQPKTSVGTVNKTIAIALCLSGILFGEGFVCILMASPLFFLVGTIVGKLRATPDEERSVGAERWSHYGIALLAPLCLEGVVPKLEMPRAESVSVTRVVAATPAEVRDALSSGMRFDLELPRFLQLGFPKPGRVSGQGLAVGDRRTIEFLHGHHPGTLVLAVRAATPNGVEFVAVSDDSYITHWLSWRSAEVSWRDMGHGHTLVTWTLRYRRRLDPAFYFKPLERYGVSLAAGYLIETLAIPPARPARS
jgi:hypothetical protein